MRLSLIHIFVYRPGAARAIALEFEKNPKADMILFDMEVPQDRATYHIDTYGRVRWYNCGRYPTYSFAARTEKLHEANVTFSLLFGGGARSVSYTHLDVYKRQSLSHATMKRKT